MRTRTVTCGINVRTGALLKFVALDMATAQQLDSGLFESKLTGRGDASECIQYLRAVARHALAIVFE
ncbi:hypothetical protein RZS08_08645, partial [Arthrospira platensis SPKY1]|nr:hypothetical protein [Arthrospira platensis SPKY1]